MSEYHLPVIPCVYCAKRKSLQPVTLCNKCVNAITKNSDKVICSYENIKPISVKKIWTEAQAGLKPTKTKYVEMSELIKN